MKKSSILIVDDLPNVRISLRTNLRSMDYSNITEATNGDEANEIHCRLRHDIVFKDIKMPILNGLEASKTMKA